MSKFEHEYQQRGVVFLAVDAFEPIEGAREFVKTTDLRYTWLRAEAEALEALGVRGVPTQIIVDRAGKVAWTSSLASTSRGAPAIQEALDAVLAQ